MKLCIIGNSHVGSLKRAWEKMAHQQSLTIDFFASGKRSLEDVAVEEGLLVPVNDRLKENLTFTSGGKSFIDPSEYDAFLLYALEARGFFIDPRKNFSSAVIEQSANDHISGTLSFDILRKLRNITTKPIFVGHTPLLSFRGKQINEEPPESYSNGLKIINRLVYKNLDSYFVGQPLDTITNQKYTKKEFSEGSKRLDVGRKGSDAAHPTSDGFHMNDKFGEKWLSNFLESHAIAR